MLTFNFNKLNLSPESKILDVGCGEGRHIFGTLHAFKDIYCIGYDQHIPSLNICKDGLDFFQELNLGSTIFVQGSVYKLPFEDNSFDLIFCSYLEKLASTLSGKVRIVCINSYYLFRVSQKL